MENKAHPDGILLGLCVLLIGGGILILASVSASFSLQKTGTTFYFLNHQLLFGLLPGLLFGFLAFLLPLAFFKKWSFLFLIGNIILLGLVFVPGIGEAREGVHRWIFLGPLSFQPSEFLKITFILYMASWLASKYQPQTPIKSQKSRNRARSPTRTLMPFILLMGLIGLLLILQPDISTLGIVGLIALLMYFLARTPLWHTAVILGGGLIALAILVMSAPYRLNRFLTFLNPSSDPLGHGYQIKQALIGIGSGGITGIGLGLSYQKFGLLPVPISDSIFAIFAEETGFLGAAILILLLFVFAWRSFQISKHVQDRFASLTAAGIALWIFFQSAFNMASMLGIVPLAGIPLPFISYGGSALVAELVAVGILLNISKYR